MFNQITGLVLAGGLSSRMGTNKALLKVQNETLLDRTQRFLKYIGCHEVLISGQYDGYHCVEDDEHLGPLSGIFAGLRACETEKMLILPVDMPYMSIDLLQLLCSFQFESAGICYLDQPFPMLLRKTDETVDLLKQLLSENTPANQRSLFRFIKLAQISMLPVSPKYNHCFDSTNTPEEWQKCLHQLNGN